MKPAHYRSQIDTLLADLNLSGNDISWVFFSSRYLPGCRQDGSFSCTQLGDVIVKPIIQIARKKDNEGQVLNTIAHELRHYWQRVRGIYRVKYDGGRPIRIWKGTSYVPRPERWTQLAYGKDPTETDARAYARDATLRLFGFDTRVTETHKEAVEAVFRRAL